LDHQTPTGIQRHRLRALFGRADCRNTTGADLLNDWYGLLHR